MKSVVFEIDEVSVPLRTLELARSGSSEARTALAGYLVGLVLSKGRARVDDDSATVSLRELAGLGVIQSVTVGEWRDE